MFIGTLLEFSCLCPTATTRCRSFEQLRLFEMKILVVGSYIIGTQWMVRIFVLMSAYCPTRKRPLMAIATVNMLRLKVVVKNLRWLTLPGNTNRCRKLLATRMPRMFHIFADVQFKASDGNYTIFPAAIAHFLTATTINYPNWVLKMRLHSTY